MYLQFTRLLELWLFTLAEYIWMVCWQGALVVGLGLQMLADCLLELRLVLLLELLHLLFKHFFHFLHLLSKNSLDVNCGKSLFLCHVVCLSFDGIHSLNIMCLWQRNNVLGVKDRINYLRTVGSLLINKGGRTLLRLWLLLLLLHFTKI